MSRTILIGPQAIRRAHAVALVALAAVVASPFIIPGTASAQADSKAPTELSVDMLRTPSSPAFIVMGIAPEAVERPGSVTDFAVSIQSATQDFSTLPENYATEFAPYWVFGGGKDLRYEDYAAGRNPFMRNLSVSFASTSHEDSVGIVTKSLGFGFRTSLIQGKIDEDFENYRETLLSLYDELRNIAEGVDESMKARIATDPATIFLNGRIDELEDQPGSDAEIERIDSLLTARASEILAEAKQDQEALIEAAQAKVAKLRVRRTGFHVDFAGAWAWSFPGNEWDVGRLHRAGVWTTGAYETGALTGLGVLRLLYERETDTTSLDFGARGLTTRGRLALSGEAVYRHYPNTARIEDSWRYDIVIEYAYTGNQALSLTFGRDFEGNEYGSDVLALLSLAVGLGSERPF